MKLKLKFNADTDPHLKASRYFVDPFDEPLDTNCINNDGYTPFDLLVMAHTMLDDLRIPDYKLLIQKYIQKFPLTKIYPDLFNLLMKLNIDFDYNIFYSSVLYDFSYEIQMFFVVNQVRELSSLYRDLQLEVGKYLIDIGET
jgi:hypothetical protein